MADTENNKNSNSPASTSASALRFPGFTEPWQKSPLNHFAKKITRKNKDNSISNILSNSANLGVIPQSDYFDRDIANRENTDGYYVIEHGDFVYNPRKSVTAPFGPVNIYEGQEIGIISPLYLCFQVSGIEPTYLRMFFKGRSWHRFIYENGDSGVRHDRVSIKDDLFLQLPVSYPTKEEQCKITALLSLLDERIATQRRLIEDLEKLMSSIVDRIFSDVDGEVVKFRDILEISTQRNDGKADYRILSASQEFGMIERDSLDIDIKAEAKSVKMYKRVHPGDYVLHLRSFQGGLAFAEVEGICSPAYTILRPNKRLEYGYLKEYFNSSKFIKSLVLVTYGIRDGRSINVEEFLDMNISIHHKNKQAEIVKSLSMLSDKLNVEASILNRYEQQRAYLLSNLFI
ncbi:restriction endonuclease subunit S [uncultured Akkermansia sp.]|uniref:restriction endonuclease subunit S n=1 Tax=uncultured Akkermansia sp. TaxID=512294 RepID=UPI00260DAE2F|nr:restriction endonuclease subunit S [uncultured Akkermansia sp.]